MSFGFSGKQDVYIQVAARFEQYIQRGIYKNGDRLPSVRVTAVEMGVNPNTVTKAYRLLEQQGYVCSLPKKGVFVIREASGAPPAEELLRVLTDWKENGVSYEELIFYTKEVFDRHD